MPRGVHVRTEEMRKKQSDIMKGRKHSEETKRKIGETLKGRTFTEEWKKKLSEAKKGVKLSDEHRKNISKAQLRKREEFGYINAPETRKKISEALTGRKLTEEHKKKLSEAHKGEKGYWFGKHLSEETKRKVSKANKGKKLTDDTKKKMSEIKKGEKNPFYGKKHSEETKKKISESLSGEKHFNWNPNREEVYAPYGENFYDEELRHKKRNLQNGRDMLTGTKLKIDKRLQYHHIDYDKSNDDPDNHCFLSINNHARISGYQKIPIKSEKYKKILQENTLALKNGEIPKYWSQINKELFRQEKLKQLDLSSYIM